MHTCDWLYRGCSYYFVTYIYLLSIYRGYHQLIHSSRHRYHSAVAGRQQAACMLRKSSVFTV